MRATLLFVRPDEVSPDTERPGLLRARYEADEGDGDLRTCELTDLADPATVEPGLEAAGFETIDLSANDALQRALADVRRHDRLTDETQAAIRTALTGMPVRLTSGTALRIDHVVDDGLFHRRSGPGWVDVNPAGIDGANGHGGAQHVHGDQDVYGTPLRQLMHGAAPDTFRHVTPDGRNDDATTFLLNLWIPVHAPVQPLALMDHRTLDGPRHQLRYGLPVDGFLERDDDAAVNDIWRFLHHDDQRWYVRTDMDCRHGYLFNTLGTGHGAACLSGEESLVPLFHALRAALAALDTGDRDRLAAAVADPPPVAPPDDTTATIRSAWQRMSELVTEARALLAANGSADVGDDWDGWRAAAADAVDRVIRRSVEVRLVASVVSAGS